ncbi:hypothetical protein BB561_000814 [Smittium simulii]|uniref:Exoribonuclease phosphorolytic domain-containing protein n=1 Tax=Smittium simulii TaxID=133385 RepID=A0A2T9YXE4_9FUNG|nr:hypothetical protein BB561_000814 [Smittium simulii]
MLTINSAASTPIFKFEKGLLSNSHGSGSFAIGKTKSICSIFGPVETKPNEEISGKAALKVVVISDKNIQAIEGKQESDIKHIIEAILLHSLNEAVKYKFSLYNSNAQKLSVATAINSCSIALVDAGIPIKSIFTASCCCITEDSTIIPFPSDEQIENSVSFHNFAFIGESCDLPIFSNSTGKFTKHE